MIFLIFIRAILVHHENRGSPPRTFPNSSPGPFSCLQEKGSTAHLLHHETDPSALTGIPPEKGGHGAAEGGLSQCTNYDLRMTNLKSYILYYPLCTLEE